MSRSGWRWQLVVGATMAFLSLASGAAASEPVSSTVFTYQGELREAGQLANGVYDLEVGLYDQPLEGTLLGTLVVPGVEVADGVFSVELDFGVAPSACGQRWLEVAVRPDGEKQLVRLVPRQPLETKADCAVVGNLTVTGTISASGLRTTAPVAGYGLNVIAGSDGNSVDNGAGGAFVAGGGGEIGNVVCGNYGTVGGGFDNQAGDCSSTPLYSDSATVGGGKFNVASESGATVGGGAANHATGEYATVPGGWYSDATGSYSFAAGRQAKAYHAGAIIFADSRPYDFASVTANTFRVRATGGIRFVLGIDGNGAMTWSCLVQNGTSWSCSSDRGLKENLEPVDGGQVLERLGSMPIYEWNGKGQDPEVRHVGPMAQDFAAAFGLGADDTHIATIDLDGIALAAIKQLATENQELRQQVTDLASRLDRLEAAAAE